MRQWQFLCGGGILLRCLKSVPYWPTELLQRGGKRKCLRGSCRTTTTVFAAEYGHDATVLGAVCMASFLVNLNVGRCKMKSRKRCHQTLYCSLQHELLPPPLAHFCSIKGDFVVIYAPLLTHIDDSDMMMGTCFSRLTGTKWCTYTVWFLSLGQCTNF